MDGSSEVIVTRGLSKHFGRRKAVDGLDLSVRRGEIFGFLGPNGAGKSTTIRMLLGLAAPTAGDAMIAGFSVRTARRRALRHVGAIIEAPCFYETLTARKNLELAQRLFGSIDQPRMEQVLGLVRLLDRQDDAVGTFSHGMHQRLGIARALLHRPEVVILDEPSDGLDPQGRLELREMIRDVSRRLSITVLLSSHLLNEMEVLCDRVGIIHEGRLRYQGTIAGLREGEAPRHRLGVDRPDEARRLLGEHPALVTLLGGEGGDGGESEGGTLRLAVAAGAKPEDVVALLVRSGVGVRELSPVRDSLEDIFLRLTTEPS